MSKKSLKRKAHLTLPNHTIIPLDPLPFPIMLAIAALFFLLLAYLFLILPSHTNPFDRAYATHTTLIQ